MAHCHVSASIWMCIYVDYEDTKKMLPILLGEIIYVVISRIVSIMPMRVNRIDRDNDNSNGLRRI